MSFCILETVLRDKLENRSGNPFLQNKNHSFTSQVLTVKRMIAGVCRRLAIFWDLQSEAVRCLIVLIEHYDIKTDNYESIMLEVVDRLLLKPHEIQKLALILYEKLMKCYEKQRDKVTMSSYPVTGICFENL